MTDLQRARELLDEAEEPVPIVGLAHAKVALDMALHGGRDPELAAEQADRRIAGLFDRDCGVPSTEARRRLLDARQLLVAKQEVSACGA